MSTLKVNTIRHTGASSDAITLATDGTATAKITNNLSNRNLIINGAQQIAQRQTSATTTTGIFVTDRFKSAIVGADEASTTAQVALTSSDTGPWAKGFRNALQVTNGNQTSGAGDGDTQQITYMVEAQDIANSGWDYTSASSYITLSFWVKSSVAQNFYGYLRSEDGTKQLYAFETGSLSANTWTKVTKTVPGNSNIQIDNNNGAGFNICLYAFEGADKTDAGQGLNSWGAYSSSSRTPVNTSTWWTTNDATFAITGVQLEVGDIATDFEHRSYADELLRCQRYCRVYGGHAAYQRIGIGYFSSNDRIECPLPLAPKMRTTPTMTVSSAGHWKAESPSGSGEFTAVGLDGNSSPQVAIVWGDKSGTFTGGESGRYLADNTTDARIYLSAEL